ncbi:hypothetical protein AB0C02_30005 [Micromonospora sp. NPDC048999]|uniref:hypothetical protein n=1 Tax=Micromonospora sp. NPDC048999 TaxID=3155391 RepID=UPI0033E21A35
MLDLPLASAFTVFDAQGSGCLSYGVEANGRRWFVKKATTPQARVSLIRASRLHAAVRHPAIVRPERILDGSDGPTLVYPWHDGSCPHRAAGRYPGNSSRLRSCSPHKRMIDRRLRPLRTFPPHPARPDHQWRLP